MHHEVRHRMRPPTGHSDEGITPFQIRLMLVGGGILLLLATLGWQLNRLASDATWLEAAEAKLSESAFELTTRGAIVDRLGRPLAREGSTWVFEVHYETVVGEWARRQAERAARRDLGASWSRLSGSDRFAETSARVGPWEDQLAQIWATVSELTGIPMEDLSSRAEDVRHDTGRMRGSIWARNFDDLARRYEDPEDRFVAFPIREEKGFHRIAKLDSDASAFAILKLLDRLDRAVVDRRGRRIEDPPFRVRGITERERGYSKALVVLDRSTLPPPLDSASPLVVEVRGIADSIVGSTRDRVQQEDIERRPYRGRDENGTPVLDFTGYDNARVEDIVGRSGIELEFDALLHGEIGYREQDRASGEAIFDRPPVPGLDVRLAIDVGLQARIRAILDPDFGLLRSSQRQYSWRAGAPNPMIEAEGRPLFGAAVVLDVDTGDTLALVSTPTPDDLDLDDRDYMLMAMDDEQASELGSDDRARRDALIELALFRNRAISTEYPPGSLVKPLMYVGAVAAGVFREDEVVTCNGFYRGTEAEDLKPRCWGWRPRADPPQFFRHGPLGPEEAISKSCNNYFYEVANRLGPEGVAAWYEQCGLGAPLGSGFGAALDGTFDRDRIAGPVDRLIVGIGQGPVGLTPLQAATSYARLARYGAPLVPRLVLDAEPTPVMVGTWPRNAVRRALEGMRRSAREGTAHSVRVSPSRRVPVLDFADLGAGAPAVLAKTGTAQVAGDRASHGWYGGLIVPAGEVEPRYAFAVVVEHGNSGGASAGPVAAQLVRALAAEGYLGPQAREALDPLPIEWRDALPSDSSDGLASARPADPAL